MYDPIIARWTTMDPMSEDYYQESAFAYCVNNPITLIDSFGLDWYSVVKQDKEDNDHLDYIYTTKYRSQEELDKAGIQGTYIGITGYSEDNSLYLSLMGTRFKTKTEDGKTGITAILIANLDRAIIGYYKKQYYEDEFRKNPLNQDFLERGTDMTVYINSQKYMPRHAREYEIEYGGGIVYYHVAQDLSNSSFNWGNGDSTRHGSYTKYIPGVDATVERKGHKTYRSVDWIFARPYHWQDAKNKVDKLLNGRIW